MTAPLGPGDWVECVDAANLRFFGVVPTPVRSGLMKGALYRITCLWEEGTPFGKHQTVSLFGFHYQSFSLRRFRPIHPGGALTRLLMEPVSDRIEPGVSRKSRQDQPAHDEPVSSLREVA